MGPDADAGEEVALSVTPKIEWPDVTDIPFVDVARRNVARGDQVAQPGGGVFVVLVVVGARLAH